MSSLHAAVEHADNTRQIERTCLRFTQKACQRWTEILAETYPSVCPIDPNHLLAILVWLKAQRYREIAAYPRKCPQRERGIRSGRQPKALLRGGCRRDVAAGSPCRERNHPVR
jgi:hypothetical protein